MVRAFSMLILLLFISCNNSNGQELREARKKSEKKIRNGRSKIFGLQKLHRIKKIQC